MKGKTNSNTGGIRSERVTIILTSNQGFTDDLKGVVVSIAYADVVKEYECDGNELIAKVPPYVDYIVSVSEVQGYAPPSSVSAKAVSGNTRQITMSYSATKLVVNMEDNQAEYNDIENATATIVADGVTKIVKSGESVMIPTGQSCKITWSEVEGYATPAAVTFSASDPSMTETGVYLTEVLTVNVTSDIDLPGSYTVSVSGVGSQTTASKVYKVPFGTSYTVSASAADGYNKVADQSFTANSVSRDVTVEYLEYVEPTVDLSMQDIYGSPIAQTTANCYVVKETGQYKIPLVFGNALKNGAANSAAYTKNSGSYSHDFVDYNGAVISSPYIETVSGAASSAQLSIADTDGVFSDFRIIDGSPCRYLQFKVNSVPDTGANGVVSIKNSSGAIMWSWHIWVWADDLTPVEITNSTSVKYKILPVNLASKWDSNSKANIKNWFYQFGRPTPLLCPAAYNSTSNHASYGALSFTAAGIASNIQQGILNPATFYKNSSSYNLNWFSSNSDKTYNLWDAACISNGNSDNNVVKTIYDPCPVGFKMPNGNVFTGFSKSNVVGSFSSGWKFKRYSGDTTGVFFPASGSRNASGSLNGVGSHGDVWLSSAYSQKYAYDLYFLSSGVNPQYNSNHANGYSVRPVQE